MITIDSVKHKSENRMWAALAHPARRQILRLLSENRRAAGELHQAFPIAAPAVSRHLRVLREAGLVTEEASDEDGRVHVYALRTEPLEEVAQWAMELHQFWQRQLGSLKRLAEQEDLG